MVNSVVSKRNRRRRRKFSFHKLTFIQDCIDCHADNHNTESRIKRELFCNDYDSSVRPVKNHQTTTSVSVKMMVKSYDFVSSRQVLRM